MFETLSETVRKRVLVVEDEANQRTLLERVLGREGFAVTAVGAVAEALETLAREGFDVALLDVLLPGQSGLSLAREITLRYPEVAVVLTSAYHLSNRQLERLDLGLVHFVDKPVDMPGLTSLLRTLGPGSPSVCAH